MQVALIGRSRHRSNLAPRRSLVIHSRTYLFAIQLRVPRGFPAAWNRYEELGVSAQKILVFPREHEFTALVMDCGPRRYLAAISLRGERNNLESRIDRVSCISPLE